jgi:hypothetical protein
LRSTYEDEGSSESLTNWTVLVIVLVKSWGGTVVLRVVVEVCLIVVVPFFAWTEYVTTGSDVVYFSSVDMLNGPADTGIVRVESKANRAGCEGLAFAIEVLVL